MKLSPRTNKELRQILEIITPALKDYSIGPLLFFLIFGVLFLAMGAK